jgi:hypothetical protein
MYSLCLGTGFRGGYFDMAGLQEAGGNCVLRSFIIVLLTYFLGDGRGI